MNAMDPYKKCAIDLVTHAENRFTPRSLKQHLVSRCNISKKNAAQIIQTLILEGTLCYTYTYGTSFIEISYERPVRVSNHFIVKPAHIPFESGPHDSVISLATGVSFGSGAHPTTQMALALIDFLKEHTKLNECEPKKMFDIGTGSGILAIGLAKLFPGRVLCVDTDPCAVHEARHNIQLNGLEQSVSVFHRDSQPDFNQFDIICANLRFPTLIHLLEQVRVWSKSRACLIFSGMKTEEMKPLETHYSQSGFDVIKSQRQNGWGAILFKSKI